MLSPSSLVVAPRPCLHRRISEPTGTSVFVQIAGTDVWTGRLRSHHRHGSESATFAYAEDYLARSDAYALDPTLPLHTGRQQTRVGQELLGAFTDCAPDRWGVA